MASRCRRPLAFLLVGLVALVVAATAAAALLAARAPDRLSPRGRYRPLPPRRPAIDPEPPSPDLPAPGPLSQASIGRGPGGPWMDGPYHFYCGVFHTGRPATIRLGALSLRVVNFTYTLPVGTCERVYCYDTTAVYVVAFPNHHLVFMGSMAAIQSQDTLRMSLVISAGDVGNKCQARR